MPTVRPKTEDDNATLLSRWTERWGSTIVVSHGIVFEPAKLSGFVCVEDGEIIGALTYALANGDLEIVTLDSFAQDRGIGTALLTQALEEARRSRVRRAWLITSNDNIRAMRFYQRRGWDMVAIHCGAIDAARKIKPQIPLVGEEGIALRHEIEFEYLL